MEHRVKAYYDSDEGIAWGPHTVKEMKDDLQRPRPKPKHRRTVFKIICKNPSTSSSNDTMFSAASEFEKENSSRICNIDDTNPKTEGSSMTTYYTANETDTLASKCAHDDSVITISSDEGEDGDKECVFNTYGNMHTIQVKEENRESDQGVITILDDSADENLSNHMPGKLEEEMAELILSEKPNDSGMVEAQFYLDSQKKKSRANRSVQNFNDYSSDKQDILEISLEDNETQMNQYGILQNRSQSEQTVVVPRESGCSQMHTKKNNKSGSGSQLSSSDTTYLKNKNCSPNSNENYSNNCSAISDDADTGNQLKKSGPLLYPGHNIEVFLNDNSINLSNSNVSYNDKEYRPETSGSDSSDYDETYEVEASKQTKEKNTCHLDTAKVTESHLNNNGPRLSKSNNNSNNNTKYTLKNTESRSMVYNDIPGSEICDQPKLDQMVDAEHGLNASLNENNTTMSDSIHLDLSTDASSIFDASCFYGKEPWNAEIETTTDEDEPAEPKHDPPLTVPVKPTKLTPAKCVTQKSKVTPYKKTPQVFKVPEVVSAKKIKAPDKFKDVISPVRLYIQHSPMAHLKQNVVPRPVKSPFISPKTSPSVSKTDTLDSCEMLRPVLYKPPGKNIVTTKSKQLFMPPSLGKHVKDPLVVKHEKKLNVKEVSRLTEKLGLDESSFGSEANMSTDSANMSVLCIKKNFN